MSDCMSPICGMAGELCSSCAKDKRIEKLEATIKRVSELPEKWREISYKTTDAYTNLHGCADELEAILEQNDGN